MVGDPRRRLATVVLVTRVPRSSLPDGYFHVISCGIPETPIFLGDADRRHFVDLLERVERRHRWVCHAYCLMTTHYHLVVAASRADLSDGLCQLNGTYSRRFNRRHGRFGHLFAARFSVRLIDSDEYLHEACSYVLLNPVKARLCERIEDWPWAYRIGLSAA